MLFYIFLIFNITFAYGHSWLDCVKDVGTGKNTGPADCRGYSRGYPGRVSGVNVDQIMTYRIIPGQMGQNPPVCASTQRSSTQYTSTYYMTRANAGETLRLRWTPNGHQRGAGQDPKTYTIHWTGTSGTQLNNRLDLTSSNQIVGPTQFDDDCYCNNCAGNPCYGRLTIPAGTPSGTYSFVWYWVFNRDPNGGGEEYTTCFDVQVSGSNILPPAPPPALPTSRRIAAPTSQVVIPATSQNDEVVETPTTYDNPPVDQETYNTPMATVESSMNCTSFCDSMCGVGQYSMCTCTPTQRTAICKDITGNGWFVSLSWTILLACLYYVL
jgi:hypothetical protein